jgi:hypothetical protein
MSEDNFYNECPMCGGVVFTSDDGEEIYCIDCGWFNDNIQKHTEENVPYPICPLNMYFEGDENKCDTNKCDFDTDTRSCTEACKI